METLHFLCSGTKCASIVREFPFYELFKLVFSCRSKAAGGFCSSEYVVFEYDLKLTRNKRRQVIELSRQTREWYMCVWVLYKENFYIGDELKLSLFSSLLFRGFPK